MGVTVKYPAIFDYPKLDITKVADKNRFQTIDEIKEIVIS